MRWIGWLLVIAGLTVLGYNLWVQFGGSEDFRVWEFGELLFRLFGGSAVGFQSFIENRISPELWNDFVDPYVNRQPAAAVFILPGVVLILLSALRRRFRRLR